MAFTVVSWNVCSLRVRMGHLLRLVDEHQPDVVCLQETRLSADGLPRIELLARGYRVAALGSRGRPGVAIVSRLPLEAIAEDLPGFEGSHRRLLVRVGELLIDTVYVPTRRAIGKVEFLEALRSDHEARLEPESKLVLTGDFNICFDERDFASPSMIADRELFPHRPEDDAFRALIGAHLFDCFRELETEAGHFTWFLHAPWALRRNYGMRLDYVFATANLADRCTRCEHLIEPRRWDRPSDHLPVLATFDA